MKISIIANTITADGGSVPVMTAFETDIVWSPMYPQTLRDPRGAPTSLLELTIEDDKGRIMMHLVPRRGTPEEQTQDELPKNHSLSD